MEETFDKDLENQRKTETIGIDQKIISEKPLVNLITHHVMNKYSNHGYTIS
jgi:hypothetical protein